MASPRLNQLFIASGIATVLSGCFLPEYEDAAAGTGGSGNANNEVSHVGGKTNTGGSQSPGHSGGMSSLGGTTASGETPSTDGTKATGGSSTSASTTALPTTCSLSSTGSLSIDSTGFATDGTCGGYAYASKYSSLAVGAHAVTVSPDCNSNGCTPAIDPSKICATGTVGQATDGNSGAIVGFSLMQAYAQGTAGGVPVTLTSAKNLVIRFSNSNNTALRLQLTTSVDGSGDNYCYDLKTNEGVSPATVPFASLKTSCWNNAGKSYSPTVPIVAVQLVVPAQTEVDTSFNICLLGVGSS